MPLPSNWVSSMLMEAPFPGCSGFRGLLHNSIGEWLFGYSGCCGTPTNINAELQAILPMVYNLHGNMIIVFLYESDSPTALQMIKEGIQHTHPFAPIVDHIRQFTEKDRDHSFTHSLYPPALS